MNAAEKADIKKRALALLKEASAKGLSTADAARICKRSPDQVARYLTDVCHPSPKVAERIVRALA